MGSTPGASPLQLLRDVEGRRPVLLPVSALFPLGERRRKRRVLGEVGHVPRYSGPRDTLSRETTRDGGQVVGAPILPRVTEPGVRVERPDGRYDLRDIQDTGGRLSPVGVLSIPGAIDRDPSTVPLGSRPHSHYGGSRGYVGKFGDIRDHPCNPYSASPPHLLFSSSGQTKRRSTLKILCSGPPDPRC